MLASSENKKISDKPPSEYVKQYRAELGEEQFNEVMASNLVPSDAVQLMLADDFADLLEVRSQFLSEVVRNLV
jgi:hypothetical protein